jgi:hypothetical protein
VTLKKDMDSPYVESLCEKENCENKATRIIKDFNTYSWVCEDCYGKYRP